MNEKKRKTKEYVKSIKEKLGCFICGENHSATLEFHHVHKKKANISKMISRNRSLNSIKKEMKKCKVICANCHRKLHWEEDH